MTDKIKENQKDFVNSYLQTAAWVTCESGENQEFTKAGKAKAADICSEFIDKVFAEFSIEDAERLLNIGGHDLLYLAGHDLFLTQNRHGSGFWDKDEYYGEEEAKKLTEIAHSIGEVNCYHIRGGKSKLTLE